MKCTRSGFAAAIMAGSLGLLPLVGCQTDGAISEEESDRLAMLEQREAAKPGSGTMLISPVPFRENEVAEVAPAPEPAPVVEAEPVPEVAGAVGDRDGCNLTVTDKSVGAVGDPCATTAGFMRSIGMSEEKIAQVFAMVATVGHAGLAH